MTWNKVLLIGSPFLYDLVDEQILKENYIQPLYSYIKKDENCNILKNDAVIVENLTVDAFAEIIDKETPNAIVCYNDNFLIQTAKIRDIYNIPGLGFPEINKFKLKSEMYGELEGILPTPRTIKLHSTLRKEDISNDLGEGDYFIKPDNLAGSEATMHVTSLDMYEQWSQDDRLKNTQYIMQKYYDLPLVHCELYMSKGQVEYIQARRYSYPNHMILKGKIIASFPINDPKLGQNIEDAAILVAKALNYNNGVMHTEFFLDHDGTLIFLETNIRQAGGAINLIHKKRSGLSMETAMILLELGKRLPLKKNLSEYEICGYIPIQEGQVESIEIPKLKSHYHFDVKLKVGDVCQAPKSASHVAAAFIGVSDNLDDLESDFRCLEKNSVIKYRKCCINSTS